MMPMDTGSDSELPRGVALAWGIAADPQRGPRRELNLEAIVEAAVRIADADGIGSVSMSSVAGALGFTTMSLYRHVSAKDDLILLMQEAGLGLPPLTIGQATPWREGLTRWHRAVLDVYAEHPWLLDIPIEGEPNTPNNLAWLDAGLSVLVDTPLPPSSRVSALLLLSGYSRWAATIFRNHDGPTIGAATLAELVTPEQFPFLAPAIAAGAFEDPPSGHSEQDAFDFGLQRILDGLETHIAGVESADPSGAASITPAPEVDPNAREISRDERVRKARTQVKDAEAKLRDARQKQREAESKARERLAQR